MGSIEINRSFLFGYREWKRITSAPRDKVFRFQYILFAVIFPSKLIFYVLHRPNTDLLIMNSTRSGIAKSDERYVRYPKEKLLSFRYIPSIFCYDAKIISNWHFIARLLFKGIFDSNERNTSNLISNGADVT